MKANQKSVKKTFPSMKRSSTPCVTKRKSAVAKAKSGKNGKVNTEPLPSPNNSFNDEVKKATTRTTQRHFYPVTLVKLNFYLKLEKKLWSMVQSVNDPNSFNKAREEFWELVLKGKVWEIEDCFKELKVKKSVRKALIVELCGVMISTDLYRANDAINNLKNLSLFIHQNYIEVLYQIQTLVKLPQNQASKSLKSTLQTSRMTTVTDKKISLNQNTEILSGLLKDICKHFRQYSKQSDLSSSIFSILKIVNKVNYPTVREVINQALSLSEPILIPPEEPFLPQVPSGTYTLVLDLDETLVHFVQNKDEGAVYIRPGCDEFLKLVSQWFELVVFTAGLQDVIEI